MRDVLMVLGAAVVGGAVVVLASKRRADQEDWDREDWDDSWGWGTHVQPRDIQWRNHPSNRNWTPRVLN